MVCVTGGGFHECITAYPVAHTKQPPPSLLPLIVSLMGVFAGLMTGVSTEGYTTHAGAHSTPTGTLCRPNASLPSLLCCSNNPGMHTEAKSNEGMHIQLGFYRLSIFQPADAWLGFAAGCAGHSVISAQVLLCAADVLHPLGKSCRRAKSDLQSYVM